MPSSGQASGLATKTDVILQWRARETITEAERTPGTALASSSNVS